MSKSIEELIEKAKRELSIASHSEEKTGEVSDSLVRRYWEGYIDALERVREDI